MTSVVQMSAIAIIPCVHLEEVQALHQTLSNHRSYQVLKGTTEQKLALISCFESECVVFIWTLGSGADGKTCYGKLRT